MTIPEKRHRLLQAAQREYAHGLYAEAIETCRELLAEAPRDADALLLAGLAVASQRQPGHALAWLKSAARERPNDAQCWYHLAVTAADMGMPDESVDAYRRCLALQPRHGDALLSLAGLCYARGDASSALPYVERALRERPEDPRLNLFMAKIFHDLRCLDEAEPWYEMALKLAPGDPKVQWEYAMQLLLTGRFENGWEYYEARVPAFGHQSVTQYPFPYRPWRGETLEDATLIVHGEQGLGDEIMFASIVPELIAQAKKVVLACSPSLAELFRRSFPGAAIEPLDRSPAAVAQWRPEGPYPAWLAKYEPIHLQCPMGSLPRFRRASRTAFPTPAAYLAPDPARVAEFGSRLRDEVGKTAVRKVGLVWMGNLATGLMGQRKSIPLLLLAPLAAIPGVRFVSLHNAEYGRTAREAPELRIVDFSEDLKTLDDTAALAANCDLVISVDTVVAHLAGALGIETWVPLWFTADWRYLDRGDTCLWYPHMRLFRQTTAGDWGPLVRQIATALEALNADHLPASLPAARQSGGRPPPLAGEGLGVRARSRDRSLRAPSKAEDRKGGRKQGGP